MDTSVWVEHFRAGIPRLRVLLGQERVVSHPLVIGELACVRLKKRSEILGHLRALPLAEAASDEEVLQFIEKQSLHRRGIGFGEAHLLASCRLSRVRLWTRIARLDRVARALRVAWGRG